MKEDAIALVEAAYDLESSDRPWMQRLVDHAIPLVPGATRGVAYAMDASEPARLRFGMPVSVGFDRRFERELLRAMECDVPTLRRLTTRRRVTTISEALGARAIGGTPSADFVLRSGAPDAFGCVALDAEGRGVVLSTDLPRAFRPPRAVRSRWELLSAHLGAAHRLRMRNSCGVDDDCVVEPGGRVVHAQGHARVRGLRERLRVAVIARDRACTHHIRADPEEALTMWTGLVAGRWSLFDRFERDGRRYVVARRNDPRPAAPLGLSLRERQVCAHFAQGDSVKITAYALGLSPSTVSEAASRMLLKLGVRNIAELAPIAEASWR